MKQGLSYAFFGTVVAVAAGLIGAYGLPDFSQPESSFASAQMLGHVTYTLTDTDGNIKAYRQLDNIIVNNGEDCAAMLLFGRNGTGFSGTSLCGGETRSFNVIGIGNVSTTAVAANAALNDEHNTNLGSGLIRAADSDVVMTAAAAGTPAKAVISNDFTLNILAGLVGQPQIINESGLFNNTVVDSVGMFSHQTFADVSMNDGETLTVEWTINIGGTGSIDTGTEET